MRKNLSRIVATSLLAWAVVLSAIAQTAIKVPKNKYKIEDDIKIGQKAAQEAENSLPILQDADVTRYVQSVGNRLVGAIPPEYQQPQFRYTFKVVNDKEINAFALPGGPMYINRGVIEVARNEGELAGVMAHEISHVVLRHATAQLTKMNNPLNQILAIGSVLGGAILGGDFGAQLGMLVANGYFLRYSREYEKQADILGAQIMARAGYDPRDLANMFRTIEQRSGSRGPEWLSSHPDPGKRYETINREAQQLNVSSRPIKVTPEFLRIQQRLRGIPQAPSRGASQSNSSGNSRASTGRYEKQVPLPSGSVKNYSNEIASLRVPTNWEILEESNRQVIFAPRGAYGEEGFTHGAMIGSVPARSANLSRETQDFINSLLQSNDYLQQIEDLSRTRLAGRNAVSTVLAGRSPITGRIEVVTVYTTFLSNGDLFYLITVVPQNEAAEYDEAFSRLIRSLILND